MFTSATSVLGSIGFGGVLGILGVIVAIGALIYSRRQTKMTVRDDARDEALQLAEVRRQVIADLTHRVDSLREELHRVEARYEDEVDGLKKRIQQVREEATETQHTLAVSVRLSLRNVRAYLEHDPPDVPAALHDLRDMLDGDVPRHPLKQES